MNRSHATRVRWYVEDGRHVEANTPICELETEKPNMDLQTFRAGILHHIAKLYDVVEVTSEIFRVDPD